MSLFQSRIYWSTKVGIQEEFDERHLVVANIDSSADNQDKIVVASFNGYLRIFGVERGDFK